MLHNALILKKNYDLGPNKSRKTDYVQRFLFKFALRNACVIAKLISNVPQIIIKVEKFSKKKIENGVQNIENIIENLQNRVNGIHLHSNSIKINTYTLACTH